MEKYEYTFEEVRPARKRRGFGIGKAVALMLAVALVAGAAGFGGAALYGRMNPAEESVQDAPAAPVTATAAANVKLSSGMTPEELYEAVLPSCVGITVSTTVNIFGQTTTSAASGSGFVLTADGYIATNYHVIEEAAEQSGVDIEVSFENGDRYEAKLVGGDEDNDIAVIKIDAAGLTPVTLGDSDSLKVAQWVCTVGNPLGELTFSFSDGRVSALDRVISTGESADMNMLQTNCAINPGNSGGPLFDETGRVVGIDTAKYTNASSDVSAEGLGFALPIDDVKEMLTDLMTVGYVTGRPLLGVTVSGVSSAMSRYGIPGGAAVESVNEGSCAEKAGLQTGDIITALDGETVDSTASLSAALSAHRAGDTVTLTVYRQGQTLELTVTLDEKTGTETVTESNDSPYGGYGWPFGGYGYGGYENGGEAA